MLKNEYQPTGLQARKHQFSNSHPFGGWNMMKYSSHKNKIKIPLRGIAFALLPKIDIRIPDPRYFQALGRDIRTHDLR